MLVVDVTATRQGIPYTFRGVMVSSITELNQKYAANGFAVDGYEIISGQETQTIGDPAPVQTPGGGLSETNARGTGGDIPPVTEDQRNAVSGGSPSGKNGLLVVAAILALLWMAGKRKAG